MIGNPKVTFINTGNPKDTMSNFHTTKIRKYDKERSSKFIGESKPFPNLQSLVSQAVSEKLDKLEAMKN